MIHALAIYGQMSHSSCVYNMAQFYFHPVWFTVNLVINDEMCFGDVPIWAEEQGSGFS